MVIPDPPIIRRFDPPFKMAKIRGEGGVIGYLRPVRLALNNLGRRTTQVVVALEIKN